MFKKIIYLFRLSYVFFKKDRLQNSTLFLIFLFLITINFTLLTIFFISKNIVGSYNLEHSIVVSTDLGDSKNKLNFELYDEIVARLNSISNISYSYIFKIPISAKVGFRDIINMDTELFLMSYDFDSIMNKPSYKEISNKNGVGLIISNKALRVLQRFISPAINNLTLKFLDGELYFGSSSILGSKYDDTITKNFYIRGTSSELPIYAIAIDHSISDEIMGKLGISRDDFNIFEIRVDDYDLGDEGYIFDILSNIRDEGSTKFSYSLGNIEVFETMQKYNLAINYILTPLVVLSYILIFYIFILALQLSIEQNSKNINTLKYLKFRYSYISSIFYIRFIFIFMLALVLFFIIFSILYSSLDSIISRLAVYFGFMYTPNIIQGIVFVFISSQILLLIVLFMSSNINIRRVTT